MPRGTDILSLAAPLIVMTTALLSGLSHRCPNVELARPSHRPGHVRSRAFHRAGQRPALLAPFGTEEPTAEQLRPTTKLPAPHTPDGVALSAER